MDPFIEAQGEWDDFHNKLLGDMERYLSHALPARYAVRLGERSYIEHIDPTGEREGPLFFKPDVGIKSAANSERANRTSVLEETAVEMVGLIETEFREMFIDIHEVEPQHRLVTGIEVLSPANKRPGTVGWYQYERKRKVFLEGHANLVELDLLRSGKRHAMAQSWPESPYYLLVMRKELAPRCKVWAGGYREPLPRIPVPLAQPDADVALDLQTLINAVYDRSRYRRDIDYGQSIRPALAVEDNPWLQARLLQLPAST